MSMVDVTLERRFVGCAMVDLSVLDRSGVGLDDITSGPERQALECLFSLRERGDRPSREALEVEFTRRGWTHLHGLNPYDWATHSSDISAIASRLRELRDARELYERGKQLCEAARDVDLGRAREHMRSLWDIRQAGTSESRVKSLRGVCAAVGEALTNTKRDDWPGLGWPSVDKQVRMSPGQLLVLGAQTNVGKTTALTTWAMSLAAPDASPIGRGRPMATGLISVEDGAVDIGAKWMGQLGRFNPGDLFFARGEHQADIVRRFGKAVQSGAVDAPLYFSEVVDRSLDSVLMDMSYMKSRHNVEVVMVDYLQAIMLPTGTRDVRTGINNVLSQLIAQAGRLGVRLVLASQLSRPPKEKPYREPTKYDLKESGDVENRAQAIVMLWKDEHQQVWGKVDKCKQSALDPSPFPLERQHDTGALVEGVKENEFRD